MTRGWGRLYAYLFALVFVVTGGFSLVLSLFYGVPNANVAQQSLAASGWRFEWALIIRPIFGTHMYCWMVLGIIAKQIWEAYRKPDRTTEWLDPLAVMMPLLLSPIIFYPIYALWTQNGSAEIVFVLNLMAFQTGFFWQTLLESARLPVSAIERGGSAPDATAGAAKSADKNGITGS